MKKEFKNWLIEDYGMQENSAYARTKNISTIEKYYGDIDSIIAAGKVATLLSDLSYSTDDERNHRAPAHNIPINGNIRTGSATLKQALRRYLEFLQTTSKTHQSTQLEDILDTLVEALAEFKPVKKKLSYDRSEVKDFIQQPLLKHLEKALPNINWEMEFKINSDKRDSIDIFGKVDDDTCVIIEIDTERADQVCKKYVSRQALTDDQNSIYVVLTYPNQNCNSKSGRKELLKYKNYLTSLTNLSEIGTDLEKYIYFHRL
ncbi:MAG: hypothetical protein K2G53_09655 [Muribaculaceae bacterium]|nr:hypothetical protein [Muribaculaceae bacterium]